MVQVLGIILLIVTLSTPQSESESLSLTPIQSETSEPSEGLTEQRPVQQGPGIVRLVPDEPMLFGLCYPRSDVYHRLKTIWKVEQIGWGYGQNGGVIEIWRNREKGHFVILEIYKNGAACTLYAGPSWTRMNLPQGLPL